MTIPSEPMPLKEEHDFIRLHPASLVFAVGRSIRAFLLPGLYVYFRGGENFEIWLMILAVPMFLYALFRYLTFRFRLGEKDMIVRSGLIFKNERIVPYSRIQSLDSKRSLIHRILGVSELLVQTASGSEPEATLSVLGDEHADAVRRQIAQRKANIDSAEQPIAPPMSSDAALEQAAPLPTPVSGFHSSTESTVAKAGIGDLAIFGLITNRGWLAVAAISGLAWQFNLWPEEEWFEDIAQRVFGIESFSWQSGAIAGLIGLICVVLIVRALSVVWSIISLYDFSLVRDDEELRTRFGLLTQHAMTIPRHRIQLIDIESSPVSRWLKRVTVRARTAGAMKKEENGMSRDWLMPIYRNESIGAMLKEVQPDIEGVPTEWTGVSPRGRWRSFVRSLPIVGVIGGVCIYFASIWGWIATAALLATALVAAFKEVANIGYALTPNAIWFREGIFWKKARVIRFNKLQTITVTRSPFDRRHGHASLRIDTANSGLGQFAVTIPFLEDAQAESLRSRLSEEAERREFTW